MSSASSTPWKPATTTTLPRSSSSMMRWGTMSTIRALRWTLLVRIPACNPVREIAGTPSRSSAIAISGAVMVSPVERSWSISRLGGAGLTLWARLISSSVLSPMALTTATTRPRLAWVAAIRRATRWISSALATLLPPNFWTMHRRDVSVRAESVPAVMGPDPRARRSCEPGG